MSNNTHRKIKYWNIQKPKRLMKYEKIISNKLNELLTKNYDAEKGYINAINEVDSVTVKNFFKTMAEQRSAFARELRTEILTYGQIPEDTGSVKGLLHRNWMSLKSTFSSNNEETILNEALRGEKASLEEYNELLKDTTFPPRVTELLKKQRNAVESAINSVRMYEEILS